MLHRDNRLPVIAVHSDGGLAELAREDAAVGCCFRAQARGYAIIHVKCVGEDVLIDGSMAKVVANNRTRIFVSCIFANSF